MTCFFVVYNGNQNEWVWKILIMFILFFFFSKKSNDETQMHILSMCLDMRLAIHILFKIPGKKTGYSTIETLIISFLKSQYIYMKVVVLTFIVLKNTWKWPKIVNYRWLQSRKLTIVNFFDYFLVFLKIMDGRRKNNTLFALVGVDMHVLCWKRLSNQVLKKQKTALYIECPCSLDGTFVYIFIHAL